MSPRRIKNYFSLVFSKFSQIGQFRKTLKICVKIIILNSTQHHAIMYTNLHCHASEVTAKRSGLKRLLVSN